MVSNLDDSPIRIGANKTSSLKKDPEQEIELFVEAKDLVDLDYFSVSDPICKLSKRDVISDGGNFEEVGETEVIDNNLNPKWIKHFTVMFSFLKDLDLKFEVENYNGPEDRDPIGQCTITLSELMMTVGMQKTIILTLPTQTEDGSKKAKKQKNVNNRGKLTVRADRIRKTQDLIKFQISAILKSKKFLCFGSDAPYLLIERSRQSASSDADPGVIDMVKVWKTHTAHDEIKPWWEPHQLFMTEFCNNNKMLPLRFTVYNYRNNGEHKMYGRVVTTTREIEMSLPAPLTIRDEKNRVKGTLHFNRFDMDMRPSLLEFLSQGWQMHVSIAIDFTLSNLEITDQNSLHRQMRHGEMN